LSKIDLVANLITRTAVLIAARIAALNYKVGNHSYKSQVVVESAARQLDEVVDGHRRISGKQFDANVTFFGVNQGNRVLQGFADLGDVPPISAIVPGCYFADLKRPYGRHVGWRCAQQIRGFQSDNVIWIAFRVRQHLDVHRMLELVHRFNDSDSRFIDLIRARCLVCLEQRGNHRIGCVAQIAEECCRSGSHKNVGGF